MAASRVTPVDVITGMALPIISTGRELPLDNPDVANEHHGNHPRADLIGDIALNSLRNSQVQLVEVELHNMGTQTYHNYFRGIRVPRQKQEIFKRCHFATVGYVPEWGIDLHSGEPIIRPMTREEQAFLRVPHPDPEEPFAYRHIGYRYEPVRNFFREYVFGQSLPHMMAEIDKFIEDGPDKGIELGTMILKQAVVRAIDPIRDLHRHLRDKQLLNPAISYKPEQILRYKLGMPDRDEAFVIEGLHAALLQRRECELSEVYKTA